MTADRQRAGVAAAESPRSASTERSVALVADRRPAAEALGRGLAALTHEPDAFAARLGRGFADLADPEYLAGQRRVAPGIGQLFGVRWPLIAAVERGFRAETRRERPSGFLELADRLFRELELEPRWFAFGLLDAILPADPERAWQLLRRAAREAGDWITVDSLAHPVGRGILLEPYRWAELEQLIYSPSRWERRLVGSTVATLPFVDRRRGRAPEIGAHGLDLIGSLIGDAEPDVQKALSWALRSLTLVDAPAVAAFVEREATRAAGTGDGQRTWVLRDTLAKLPPDVAALVRARLAGIRRSAAAPATSAAAALAARFTGDVGLPDPRSLPEPPL
jgi:3-methyladenine DNA glycosylase AlkD